MSAGDSSEGIDHGDWNLFYIEGDGWLRARDVDVEGRVVAWSTGCVVRGCCVVRGSYATFGN